MKLTWVNHASFIVSYKNVSLICDPWLEGDVFFKGWSLISDTVFQYEEFKTITHIWFSHEHPDHFCPPVLEKIPIEYRKKITILFQYTLDKQVIRFCKKLGFDHIVELRQGHWHLLGDDFKILCSPEQEGAIDSWCALQINHHLLLNLNDCVFDSESKLMPIAHLLNTQSVDILLTQFSYAQWEGNPDQPEKRQLAATRKKTQMLLQASLFQPKQIIPFASYVYFSNRYNFYMNDCINHIQDIATFLEKETSSQVMVLYPGDTWTPGTVPETQKALCRYGDDLRKKLSAGPTQTFVSLPPTTVIESAQNFIVTLKNLNSSILFWIFKRIFLHPFTAYILDHEAAYHFSLDKGLVPADLIITQCDIALPSELLVFCFQKPWGGETLEINGSFQKPSGGNFHHFHIYFRLYRLNNLGYTQPKLWLFFGKKLAKKLLNKLQEL